MFPVVDDEDAAAAAAAAAAAIFEDERSLLERVLEPAVDENRWLVE